MRTASLVSVVLLFAIVVAPANGQTYTNAVELFFVSGSGDFQEPGVTADATQKAFALQYTHYFTPIKTDDSPYGERVFLQHPSELSLSVFSSAIETKFMGNTLESDDLQASIAGTFYFPNRQTALGLGIGRAEGQDNRTNTTFPTSGPNFEHSSSIFQLFAHHYVTDSARVGISLDSEDYENKSSQPGGTVADKYEERLWTVYADALMENKFKFGAYLGKGERKYTFPAPAETYDLLSLGVQAGMYVSKTTGLFLAYDTAKEDGTGYEQRDSQMTLTVDHWFSESGHVALSFASLSIDSTESGTTATMDITELMLMIGFLF